MKKILLTFLAALALASAVPAQTTGSASPDPGIDSQTLARLYIENALKPRKNVQYAALDYTTLLDEQTAKLYSILYPYIIQVASGERTSTEFSLDLSSLLDKTTYSATELGLATFVSGGKITDEAKARVAELTNFDFGSAVDALMHTFPADFYWYDKTVGFSWRGGSYSCTASTVTLNLTYTASFAVSEEYQAGGQFTMDPQYGQSLAAAAANVQSIIADHATESDYSKLVSYQKAIHGLVDYNNEAADDDDTPYGNPWQMIWVFDNDPDTKVVCEGYAKAFQYLCDLSAFKNDIYAICATGQLVVETSGAHMWNIVRMDDGKNYLVDVTNSDEGTVGYPEYLFLDGYAMYQNDTYYYKALSNHYVGYLYDAQTLEFFTADQLALSSAKYVEHETIDISGATVSAIGDAVYTGSAITPDFTVTLDGARLTEGTDYAFAFADNKDAGTARLTITGKGNYDGQIVRTFTINKAVPAYTVPTIGALACNATIRDIVLPSGFSLETTGELSIGTNSLALTFTPADTKNYETVTGIAAVVNVNDHTPAAAVIENEIAATYEQPGSYDEVVYCSVCHKELSRESGSTPALEPEPDEPEEPEEPEKPVVPEEPEIPTPVSEVAPAAGDFVIKTFPNPAAAHSQFTISCKNAADIYIYKADGRLVERLTKVSPETQLSLSAGQYFCVAIVNGKRVSHKFVVR